MVTPIAIKLIGQKGDDLGRVALTNHSLGRPGQSAGRSVSSDVDREMTDLCVGIRAVVSSEGLETSLDEIGLRLAVSQALMTASEDGAEIPVPVKEASPAVNINGPDTSGTVDRDPTDQPVADWDSLLATDTEGGATDV